MEIVWTCAFPLVASQFATTKKSPIAHFTGFTANAQWIFAQKGYQGITTVASWTHQLPSRFFHIERLKMAISSLSSRQTFCSHFSRNCEVKAICGYASKNIGWFNFLMTSFWFDGCPWLPQEMRPSDACPLRQKKRLPDLLPNLDHITEGQGTSSPTSSLTTI